MQTRLTKFDPLLSRCLGLFAAGLLCVCTSTVSAQDPQRGYELLTEKPYLTPDFSDEVFDLVWISWPEPLRSVAEKASPQQRREMAFERYGLTPRPGGGNSDKPLQYVVDADGNWTMNCFSCHGGTVYGKTYPGAPNNRFALQTMTEEIRATKFRTGSPLSRMDLGSVMIPLGTTHGTTNAVVFGLGLMHQRDEDLNLLNVPPKTFLNHDMDAPPWWHFHKRPSLYIDGFAQKGHRGLMQFMMIPENGPEFFRDNEDDFRHVFAYLESLRPPKYDGPIDVDLAEQGRGLFNQNCAECHGTYGEDGSYPNRRIPLADIGTDTARLDAIASEGRQKYANSWFAHAGTDQQQTTVIHPDGYVAPPLDGVWASPPYFHNGSVPTLWHVLHPEQRPTVWRRVAESIDREKIGFQFETVDRVPLDESDVAVRRTYFDTRRLGKSNQGHLYPQVLSGTEKTAVLEYLKTL